MGRQARKAQEPPGSGPVRISKDPHKEVLKEPIKEPHKEPHKLRRLTRSLIVRSLKRNLIKSLISWEPHNMPHKEQEPTRSPIRSLNKESHKEPHKEPHKVRFNSAPLPSINTVLRLRSAPLQEGALAGGRGGRGAADPKRPLLKPKSRELVQ